MWASQSYRGQERELQVAVADGSSGGGRRRFLRAHCVHHRMAKGIAESPRVWEQMAAQGS